MTLLYLSLSFQPLMNYEFAYEVSDDATTNYQNRVEFVEDGVLQGSYSLLSPDGVVRTSVYTDTGSGFEVSYCAIRQRQNLIKWRGQKLRDSNVLNGIPGIFRIGVCGVHPQYLYTS